MGSLGPSDSRRDLSILAALEEALPVAVRRLAAKSFELLKTDPRHPALHFKRIGAVWSVRVGLHYRALAAEDDGCRVWFWIGSHDDYDRLLS